VALLARVAERIYWGARYVERAEDTARIIRSYGDLLVDLPARIATGWEPLLALTGNHHDDLGGELDIVHYLIADAENPGSIRSTVGRARENLRTTREVVPREGWYTLNSLGQYVDSESERAVARRMRDRFLGRVIDESRRLDGVLESTMTRSDPFRMWRLGRLIERSDMTTRVVGVRAASLLQLQQRGVASGEQYHEVQWMGALRSVSALQMYQRAVRGPIEGPSVVRFLLFHTQFPRSVRACLDEIRMLLSALPEPEQVLARLDTVQQVLASCDLVTDDGVALDAAMDRVQGAVADLGSAVQRRYLSIDASAAQRAVQAMSS
jgi:uncharacterized alpha-E superfamily protein